MNKHSDYEENAKRQIRQWKNPERSWIDKAIAVVSWPVDKAAENVLKAPGLGPAIQKALAGMLGVINDLSQWSVRPDAIL